MNSSMERSPLMRAGQSRHISMSAPMCRTQVATQARLRGLVRERLTAVEPPPGLSARLSSALAAEATVPAAAALPSRGHRSPLRLVALLGPALAALWLVIALAVPAARSDADLNAGARGHPYALCA